MLREERTIEKARKIKTPKEYLGIDIMGLSLDNIVYIIYIYIYYIHTYLYVILSIYKYVI